MPVAPPPWSLSSSGRAAEDHRGGQGRWRGRRAPAGIMDVVLERRLRPVYDMIDSKNYKGALKQVTTLLQKHSDNLHVKMLKALVLERMGREEEALATCREVKDAVPLDERILSDLYQVYHRLGHGHESTESYENAYARSPGNAVLETALFMAYVREGNYMKQQQIAMRMYKRSGEEKALLWAVCSIELQAKDNAEQGSKLLPLAEAMLKKRIAEKGLKEHESLLVYLSILRQQGKFGAALEALEGDLGELFTIAADRLRTKGDLLMQMGQYSLARAVYEEVLCSNCDDWAVLQAYLDAILEQPISARGVGPTVAAVGGQLKGIQLAANGTAPETPADARAHLSPDEVEERLSAARKFLRELQALPVKKLQRGPLLAELEVEKHRIALLAGPPSTTEDLGQSILTYFHKYGHMVSFASDVKEYTLLVRGQARHRLGKALEKAWEESGGTAVHRARRLVSAKKVQEQLGLYSEAPNDELVRAAGQLAALYGETLPLSAQLEPKEGGYGDELLTGATSCLVEMHARTGRVAYLVEAILVLEYYLKHRSFSPTHKLLLISLYSLLGAASRAFEIFQTLGIKHIMLETMAHHVLPPLLQCGRWAEAGTLSRGLTRFHEDHTRDAPELLSVAYRNGTYSKVREFVEFEETLQRSHPRLLLRIEEDLGALCRQGAEGPQGLPALLASMDYGRRQLAWASDATLGQLAFTEDLGTRPWWWPSPEEALLPVGQRGDGLLGVRQWHRPDTEEVREKRRERSRRAAKRRCLLPRLLALALQLDPGSASDAAEELEGLVETFSSLAEQEASHVTDNAGMPRLAEVENEEVPSVALFVAALFSAAAMWLRATGAPPQAADGAALAAAQALARQLAEVQRLLDGSLRALCSAAIIPLELEMPPPGAEATRGADSGGGAGSPEGALGAGLGLRGLAEFVFRETAWLALLLRHWGTRPPQPSALTKKKKRGGEKGNEEAALSRAALPDQAREALSALLAASVTSLESTCSLLQKYAAQPAATEVAALLALLEGGEVGSREGGAQQGALEGGAEAPCRGGRYGCTLQALESSCRASGSSTSMVGSSDSDTREGALTAMVKSRATTVLSVVEVASNRVKMLEKIKL